MKICVRDMSQIANHNKFDFDFVLFLKKFRMFVTYEMFPKILKLIKYRFPKTICYSPMECGKKQGPVSVAFH